MKKRLLKIAITTALATAMAVPVFANPFTDVPTDHWAYHAITRLAQEGVISGYADGTFRGNQPMTRYEMAVIVDKAMHKKLDPQQKAVVERLAREFSDELNMMDVKIDGMQNTVDNLVKVSGDARMRYEDTKDTAHNMDYRARVTFDGKISNNLKFNARVSSGNVDRTAGSDSNAYIDTANVSFNGLGLDNTVGRQDIYLGSGFLMDDQMNGFATQYNGFKAFDGYANNTITGNTKGENIYGAQYATNVWGANLTADYLNNQTSGNKFYAANTSFKIMHGISANADYVKNQTTGDKATAYGIKFDKLGLSATYRDVGATAYTGHATMAGDLNAIPAGTAFKGMEYQYDRNLDKNTDLSIKYQNYKDMSARTSAVVNVKF
jgi:hypothetical protein